MQAKGSNLFKESEVNRRKPPISPRQTAVKSSSFVRLEREKALGGQRSTQIKELACSKLDMATDTPQFEPLSDEEDNRKP